MRHFTSFDPFVDDSKVRQSLQGAVLKYMNSFFALYYVAFFKESEC